MKSFFETLVDMDDYFDVGAESIDDSFLGADDFSGGMFYSEEYGQPETETTEPKTPAYEESPQITKIEEIIKKAEPPSQELLMGAEESARKEGEFGIKKFFDELSEKEKNSMLRYAMGAMGVSAREAIRSIQQRREQEFQAEQSQRGYALSSEEAERERQFRREMADREYSELRAREERAREERRISGTPGAYQFSVTPRGIINQGMGG